MNEIELFENQEILSTSGKKHLSQAPENQSWASWVANTLTHRQQKQLMAKLTTQQLEILSQLWLFWGHSYQRIPVTPFVTWLLLGGRGCGKTRAGSEFILDHVRKNTAKRIALIGETIHDAAEIMVFGDSGIMATAPKDIRPRFHRGSRCLTFPNGSQAFLYSSKDPEQLRGPQFDLAWCDELAKWSYVQETWDMLQFGLRLGQNPRQMVTTTPKPIKLLKSLMDDPTTVVTTATTYDNSVYLSSVFLKKIIKKYEGTQLGLQELQGKFMMDLAGSLWTRGNFDRYRLAKAPNHFDRLVVAVDPPTSSHQGSDACGIIVAGVCKNQDPATNTPVYTAYVLADYSQQGLTPHQWARKAIDAYYTFKADRLVAEVNQGGEMVRTIIHQIDPKVAYKGVYARRGKISRAEPIAALYEQGRVHHVGLFEHLEDQMCSFTIDRIHSSTSRSPDRVDALVWALTELMFAPDITEPHVYSVFE